MYNIISKHNSQILKAFQDGETAENKPFSNCKTRANCPAGDTSDSENVLYQATIFPKESINDKKKYRDVHWKLKRETYSHRHSFCNASSKLSIQAILEDERCCFHPTNQMGNHL